MRTALSAGSVDFDGWLHLVCKDLRFRVQNEPDEGDDCHGRRAHRGKLSALASGLGIPTNQNRNIQETVNKHAH